MNITCKFVSSFSESYNRNNKSKSNTSLKGNKNLRCFPACCPEGHKERGFCGRSIEFEITNEDKFYGTPKILVVAELQPLSDEAELIEIGKKISWEKLQGELKTKTNTLNRFLLASEKNVSCSSGKYNYNAATKLYEANRELLAWHYDWVGGRFKQNVRHTIVVTVLSWDDQGGGNLTAVNQFYSPSFQVGSTRRAYFIKHSLLPNEPNISPLKDCNSRISSTKIKSNDFNSVSENYDSEESSPSKSERSTVILQPRKRKQNAVNEAMRRDICKVQSDLLLQQQHHQVNQHQKRSKVAVGLEQPNPAEKYSNENEMNSAYQLPGIFNDFSPSVSLNSNGATPSPRFTGFSPNILIASSPSLFMGFMQEVGSHVPMKDDFDIEYNPEMYPEFGQTPYTPDLSGYSLEICKALFSLTPTSLTSSARARFRRGENGSGCLMMMPPPSAMHKGNETVFQFHQASPFGVTELNDDIYTNAANAAKNLPFN